MSTIITGQQLVVHKQVSLPFTYSALDIPSNTAWPFMPGRIDVFAATGSLAQLTSALST